jgi:hypothetical protein
VIWTLLASLVGTFIWDRLMALTSVATHGQRCCWTLDVFYPSLFILIINFNDRRYPYLYRFEQIAMNSPHALVLAQYLPIICWWIVYIFPLFYHPLSINLRYKLDLLTPIHSTQSVYQLSSNRWKTKTNLRVTCISYIPAWLRLYGCYCLVVCLIATKHLFMMVPT